MESFAREVVAVSIEDEMRRSYLDYAMSVIVGRALPDVRDGLKPVHRRVLFAMHELSNDWNKPFKKSARIVGDVIGKYHPHGDSAVYDTIVRMAQDFSLRYPLVDGQGNFGSVDGDNAAAMRYTEIRMSRIAHELLADIERDTVDFAPNYDGSEKEPVVLPTRVPNLLVNGSSGIAVGMATNIPPHNLTEVVNACLAYIENTAISVDELMDHVLAPDFPTRGFIYGLSGVQDAYRTGRGRVVMRARTHFEDIERSGRQAVIIDELPYQVNKASLCARIGELVREKRLEGISDLRDESDKSGMRVVIELKKGANPNVVLNQLYSETQMEDSFGVNVVALVDGRPRLLNLRDLISAFVEFRRQVVVRRTLFELKRARERGHILEGLAVALSNVDEVIALIRASASPHEARDALMARPWQSRLVDEMLERIAADASRPEDLPPAVGRQPDGYYLSEAQAQAILELRLQRLTGLERDKILAEYADVMARIADLLDILARRERVDEVVAAELREVRDQYGDERRSEIIAATSERNREDLITPEDVVVTFSHHGYVKAQPLAEYRAQRRGGRGRLSAGTKEEDFIERVLVCHTHDHLLCFTDRGQVYRVRVFDLPSGGRQHRGRPLNNFTGAEDGERVNAVLAVKDFEPGQFVVMATAAGTIKKTPLELFGRHRSRGLIAVLLDEGDRLIDAGITDGNCDIMLFSDAGRAIRFHEGQVRAMGRTARGVRGMRIDDGAQLVSMLVVRAGHDGQYVLAATEHGYGKRTPVDDYPRKGRGGLGVLAIAASSRNGLLVRARLVEAGDEVVLVTNGGILIRTRVDEVRETGRVAQGVTLINLDAGERLSGMEKVVISEPGDDEAEGGPDGNDTSGAAEAAAPEAVERDDSTDNGD